MVPLGRITDLSEADALLPSTGFASDLCTTPDSDGIWVCASDHHHH
jgi:hypothetical protein